MRKLISTFLLCCSGMTFASIASQPGDVKQFESTGQCPSCDLSGAKLNVNANFVFNLEKANLIRSNLNTIVYDSHQNSDMSSIIGIELNSGDIDYTGSNFASANLQNSDFSYCNFSSADFTNAKIDGANFSHTNLYGAKINAQQIASLGDVCNAILPDGSKGQC